MDGSATSDHTFSVPASSVPFVGRERELTLIHRVLEEMLAGRGRLLLLAGEPGIGKTRLAEQLSIASLERGARVLWGRCYEWDGAPAYWPWIQVLRGVPGDAEAGVDTDPVQWLIDSPQVGDGQTHHVNPALRGALEERRFQLFDAIGRMLRMAAESAPLVIVLDDLQWAGLPSILLLRFLSQEVRASRILFAATYRDVEIDRAHPLTVLAREPGCLRIAVRGMQPSTTARLIESTTERPPSDRLVNTIQRKTDGNPFFVGEVVRLLVDEGTLDDPDATLARHAWVPESVRDVVALRLNRLSTGCRETLALAAAIGHDFSLALVRQVSGHDDLDLLAQLDEASREHVIVDDVDEYRFSHALIQETLYAELSAPERIRLHLAIGTALEAATPPGTMPPWAELAWHFSRAAPAGGFERIVEYAGRAGDAAMDRLAWEQAVDHYRRAVEARDQSGGSDPPTTCRLLLKLGGAQNLSGPGSGDAPEARRSFLRAATIAREAGDADALAQAALGYTGVNVVAAFGGRQQSALLEEAFAALPEVDSPLRVRVLARLAADLWHRSADTVQRSRAYAEEAVTVAERIGDPTLVAYALWARYSSGQNPDNLVERLADSVQLVIAAEQAGDPIVAIWGNMLRLLVCIEAGDVVGAERSLNWLMQFDERARIPYVAQRVAATRAMMHLLMGRYTDATPQIERSMELWQSPVPHQHVPQAFLLHRDLGRLESLTTEIDLPDSLHPWRQAAQAHRMALALERGRLDAARADYEALVADDGAAVVINQHWYSTVVLLAEAAIALNDEPRIEWLLTLLDPYAERLAIDGSLLVCHGPVALYAGELAGSLGRWDDALERLALALTICERLGLRPYLVRTLLAQAATFAARDLPGDRRQASACLERAELLARELEMAGLYDRIAALRDRLAPPERGRFGLTPRELDVLRLVAEGLTDIEVAERLYLSRRTVSTHLTSIYIKLNVSSRTAAARFAVEHALL